MAAIVVGVAAIVAGVADIILVFVIGSWLLREMVAIVATDDHEATREARSIKLDEIFGR